MEMYMGVEVLFHKSLGMWKLEMLKPYLHSFMSLHGVMIN
jgi:hypothetical protein